MIRELYNWLKTIYGTPSPEAMAFRELEDSKRELLKALACVAILDPIIKFRRVARTYDAYL